MKPTARLAMSITLLMATFFLLALRSSGEGTPIRRPLERFPTVAGVWEGRETTILDAKIVDKLKLNDHLVRRYEDPAGRSLWTYIGYWQTQRKNAMIHSPKNCLPGNGWEPLEASRVTLGLPAPYGAITVNRYLIQKDQERQLVLYWYHSQGQAIAGEIAARVALIGNSAVRNRTDGAIVRISTPIYGSVSETSAMAADYVRAVYPVLREFLPE